MGIVDDVFAYLTATSGLVVAPWGLIRRRMMETPAQLIVLTEDGGEAPEIPAEQGIGDSAMYDSAIQIMVRAKPWDGDASAAKAQELFDLLHGARGITMGETEYLRVKSRTSEPIFAGYDASGRPVHTISFLCLAAARQAS